MEDQIGPDLFATVVTNGFCIGCGACAAFDPAIEIRMDNFGRYQAERNLNADAADPTIGEVCPFANGNPDENDLSLRYIGADTAPHPELGRHLATYAGSVSEGRYREDGSSGGLVSWILVELLDRGLVDYVVHVVSQPENAGDTPLFKFAISSTSDAVRAGAKSRYYPIEMSEVISEMLRTPGRYAVVGVPCFIKAIRLASIRSEILSKRVTFGVSIVCGHLKTAAFADLLGWQCGIVPGNLSGIDFRTKQPIPPASSYAVTASVKDGATEHTVTRPMSQLIGSNWGHGLLKYKACDFCDDVVGETADISIGDAWLPEFNEDPKGTNVVVVRSHILNSLLQEAATCGRIALNEISAARAVASQAGGFRHRREGLAYRLYREDAERRWRPNKRIDPKFRHLTAKERVVFETRSELAEKSHQAFASAKAQGRLSLFVETISPLANRLDDLNRKTFTNRVIQKLSLLYQRLRRRIFS